jgi:hypothetical protein
MYIPKLVGNLVFRTKGSHPLGDETPVFLGYEMKSANPVFRYRMGNRVLRESVVPGANGFKVEITSESGGPAPSWRGSGNGIETVVDGGLLKVLVADDASAK